jgi:signal transduction histidine kinase
LLSAVYLKRRQWRQAEQTALEALTINDSEPANSLALYEILSKACSHQGNSTKAGEYFDKHKALQASWSTKNYQSAMREMEVKYETGKKELQIERQQNLISRQNMQRRLLACGVAVCLIILALLWRLLRLRTRHNRDLAEMNLTKDKFFSIISHDLKNPALSQRDVLQVLVKNARSWDADTLADYHNELLKSAEGQIELIYNLLSWSKLQTGRMAFTPETFMLSDLFPNLTLIRNMAEHKNITLTVRIPEHALVTGDINILSTVVRNLLTNAVKFTPPGGQVTLEASPFDHGRGKGKACLTPTDPKGYTISVSDTGIGMTCEQVETLRTASLSLLGSARSRQGTASEQGSGLGLIVCLELLEKHGSELHVESEEGKGSRFWFEIN